MLCSIISQLLKDKYYDSTCMKALNSQVHGTKEWNGGCQQLWGGGNVELLVSGPNIPVKEDE